MKIPKKIDPDPDPGPGPDPDPGPGPGPDPAFYSHPTSSGLFMDSISTKIYTSELILCFTICVHSATRHNILK